MGGAAAGISFEGIDPALAGVEQTWIGLDPEFEAAYLSRFWMEDPWRSVAYGNDAGDVLWGQAIDRERYAKSAFLHELCRPFELSDLIATVVERDDGHLVAMSVMRPLGAEDFGPEEAKRMRTLFPHIRRVLSLATELQPIQAPLIALDTLDQLTLAVVVVDGGLRVRATNVAARAVFRVGDGVQERGGRLALEAPGAHDALQRVVAMATASLGRHGGAVRVQRRAGPLLLRVAPLWRDRNPYGQALALIVMAAPQPRVPLIELLRGTFGLTYREAEVAVLVGEGLAPKEVAVELDTAWNTVRYQLRSVFAKTGTTGQVQLVRLVHDLSMLFDGPPTHER